MNCEDGRPHRVAQFSDPGTTGQILAGDVYYLTMKPPCCADTGYYYFRSLDSGALLFKATGNGDVGTRRSCTCMRRVPM